MFSFVYEAAAVVMFGFAALRLAGKKVMAEMTTLELVTVLAIGTLIGHAVTENELWKTLCCISIFVIVLFVFQLLALKFPWVERVIIGRPTLIIRDGQVLHRNLSKLRMTRDQLEVRLRRIGIANLSEIRTATIETDGGIGYELTESSQPLTRGQAEQFLALLKLHGMPSDGSQHQLFEEIRRNGG